MLTRNKYHVVRGHIVIMGGCHLASIEKILKIIC